jgi:biotin carboxylase
MAPPKRLLLLCTTTGYQTHAFTDAAQKLGLAITFGTDRCHVLDDPWRDGALPLHFEDPEKAAAKVVEYSRQTPIHAVVAIGDRPTPTAARVAEALRLPGHPAHTADICRDKSRSRQCLRNAGVGVPEFRRVPLHADPRQLAAEVGAAGATCVGFPCVLKPLALSGSRGVIRANNPEEFVHAFERIRSLLRNRDVGALREETSNFVQIESYIDGTEVAVEGLVDRGKVRILAIFDKPDPLVGPYFEETIYVTPSRLPAAIQAQIAAVLQSAVTALGLFHGPLHAELRINSNAVWVLEVAARPIGGLCARALRFQHGMSLEELLLRHALGQQVEPVRESVASGVMMLPTPQAGILEGVENLEQAAKTPGIEAIEITSKLKETLVPLPEGTSYLGFIFARGRSPQVVESALREAHAKLQFVISPALPVL